MAGTIIADTLTHSTAGSVTTDYVVNGSAKAWVNYNQTAPSVRDSFNVSSATDVSAGIATMNWSNSFSNATYSPNVMGDADPTTHWTSGCTRGTLTGANAVFTTSAHQLIIHNIGGTVIDTYYITGQYLGDLA